MSESGVIILHKINWKEFACGWGAAFINVSVTYPINKLIFRQVSTIFYKWGLLFVLIFNYSKKLYTRETMGQYRFLFLVQNSVCSVRRNFAILEKIGKIMYLTMLVSAGSLCWLHKQSSLKWVFHFLNNINVVDWLTAK